MLVVCTGNICRSPMAEGLLRARLAEARIPARIRSAGLVTEGQPASRHGVTAMRKRGIDISEHRSQRMVGAMLDAADLVLCMERQHVREATVLAPEAFPRTFTLPEFVRRAQRAGVRRADETVDDYVGRLGRGRSPADLMSSDPADEVDDPIGGSRRDYARTAEELEDLVDAAVDHLYPAPT